MQALLDEYLDIPPVTRVYTTACVLTSLAVQLDLTSPFQLYYNPSLIVTKHQYWRLLTTFLFFGPFGLAFLFNMIFLYRYSRNLEDGSFRGRTADLVVMFLFGCVCMLISGLAVNMLFLGQAFTIMLVYVWSRRNPFIRMNFLGLMNFQAPFLPYVLLAFSLMMGNSVAVDVMGIVVGHLYYFLEDVLPAKIGGVRVLKIPDRVTALFNARADEPVYEAPPEERPGGFDWGQRPHQD